MGFPQDGSGLYLYWGNPIIRKLTNRLKKWSGNVLVRKQTGRLDVRGHAQPRPPIWGMLYLFWIRN